MELDFNYAVNKIVTGLSSTFQEIGMDQWSNALEEQTKEYILLKMKEMTEKDFADIVAKEIANEFMGMITPTKYKDLSSIDLERMINQLNVLQGHGLLLIAVGGEVTDPSDIKIDDHGRLYLYST